jgi:hypothetical protein
MHYVVKEGISADLVADADSLMREFYRADKAINNLDQNNIRNSGINYDTTYDPAALATHKRACTRTHLDNATGILYKALTGPTLLEGKWVYTSDSLSFNLATTTPFSVYASGQFGAVAGGASDCLRADVAIFYNGEKLAVPQSFSGIAHTGNIEMPFLLSTTVLLPPGDCKLYLGFFSHGSDVPTVSGANITGIGYTR